MKITDSKVIQFLLRKDLLIFIISFIIFKLFALPFVADGDVLWHIKAGDLIINSMSIPQYDSWSYVSYLQKWYNISWVWDVLVSFLNAHFTMHELSVINCFIYSLLLVALYHSLKLWVKNANETRFIVASIAGVILWNFTLFRPQLLAYFLILALNVMLKLFKDTKKLKFLIPIPLMMILWVNIHGSFILGLGVIFVYLLEALYLKRYYAVKALCIVLLISILCIFINPYGFEIILAIMRTLNSAMYKHISEWQQFCFGAMYGPSLVVAIFIALGILHKEENKAITSDKIMAFGCIFASLCAIRYFGILAILSAPYLACTIKHYVEKPNKRQFVILQILQVLVVLLGGIFAYYLAMHHPYNIMPKNSLPVSEIEFIRENYPGYRVFGNYNVGGYFIYYGDGKFKHFIDGRAGTAFSEEIILDYLKFKTLQPGWEELFDKYNINGALIAHQELRVADIANFFSDWQEVNSGEYGKFFVRK